MLHDETTYEKKTTKRNKYFFVNLSLFLQTFVFNGPHIRCTFILFSPTAAFLFTNLTLLYLAYNVFHY